MDYNVRCLITGKSDNLRMHAFRNDDGKIVGWVFIHESVDIEKMEGSIKWDFNVNL